MPMLPPPTCWAPPVAPCSLAPTQPECQLVSTSIVVSTHIIKLSVSSKCHAQPTAFARQSGSGSLQVSQAVSHLLASTLGQAHSAGCSVQAMQLPPPAAPRGSNTLAAPTAGITSQELQPQALSWPGQQVTVVLYPSHCSLSDNLKHTLTHYHTLGSVPLAHCASDL